MRRRPRVQVRSPLQNLQIRLRPTAQPRNVRPSAVPPASTNSLIQLGQALSSVKPELRELLLQHQSKEDEQALSLGQIEAETADAKASMEAIQTKIKALVDNGTISKGQLPAFERGFFRRFGERVATQRSEAAFLRTEEASRVDNPVSVQEIIDESRGEFEEEQPNRFFLEGFNSVFSAEGERFRRVVQAQRIKNVETAGEAEIATRGNELVTRLSAAEDESETQQITSELKSFVDEIKAEFPKHEVGPFMFSRVVDPHVKYLVAIGDTEGAEDFLEQMEAFDLTGKGGRLGNIGNLKAGFANLRLFVENQAPNLTRKLEQEWSHQETSGKAKASELIGNFNGDFSNQWVDDSLVQFDQQYPDATGIERGAFRRILKSQVDTRDDPVVATSLEDRISKFETEAVLEALPVLVETGQLTPQKEIQIRAKAEDVQNLVGIYDSSIRVRAESFLYPTDEFGDVQPTFQSSEIFFNLTPELREEHRKQTLDFFEKRVKEELVNTGDVDLARQGRAGIVDKVKQETIKHADKITEDLLRKSDQVRVSNIRQELKGFELNNERLVKDFEKNVSGDGKFSTLLQLPDERLVELVNSRTVYPSISGKQVGADQDFNRLFKEYWLATSAKHTLIPNNGSHQLEGALRWHRGWNNEKSRKALATAVTNYATNVTKDGKTPDVKQLENIDIAVRSLIDTGAVEELPDAFWETTGLSKEEALKIPARTAEQISQEKNAFDFLLQKKLVFGLNGEEFDAGVVLGMPFDRSQIDPSITPVWETEEELIQDYQSRSPRFISRGNALDPSDQLTPAQLFYMQRSAIRRASKMKARLGVTDSEEVN